jgi:hypothetical protein
MNLPRRIIQKQHESESYAILVYKLRNLGIFRNLTENDYGIDFEIEVVNDGKLTGKYVKVQVKSAEAVKIRKKDNVPTVSGIKQGTLWYWTQLSFSTNVLVFLVNIKSEAIYLTKPVFWQAARLIDDSNKTKTIEFLPVKDYHAEVTNALTWAYTLAPTIRDQMHFHIEAIRHLKEFIEMHLGAFWYDAHMTIQEPYIFEHFLTLSQNVLYFRKTVDRFSEEDCHNPYSIHHWKKKSEYYELYNYICQTPLSIIMPDFLDELRSLRERIIKSAYYWIHKDWTYFKLVYIHKIPNDLEHKQLAKTLDQFEVDKTDMEKEFSEFMDKFIETQKKGKS